MNYELRGAARELFSSNDPEVLICGAVGTGKSYGALVKVNYACMAFPGCRVLIARQTRRSLTETIMVEFETSVLPKGMIDIRSNRENRSSYTYPNGSHIVLGGLDDVERIMSSQYDLIYIPEAIETREADVEMLTTRLRNGVLEDPQLLMDCNPGSPKHWLKRRADRGRLLLLQSVIADNPRFHDGTRLTKEGLRYISTLEGLSAHRRARLVEGRWVDPENARFDGCSRESQGFTMRELFPQGIPVHWPRWTAGDWGKADPYCHLWMTASPAGVRYVYLEDYLAGLEAWEQGERIVRMSPANDLRYQATYLDKSMWSKEKSFGGDPELGPAASQYRKAFDEGAPGKFGELKRGAQNTDEEGYITLHRELRKGALMIEQGCTNTWDEIENAVHYEDPRTGAKYELVNPYPGKKFCPDHALETLVYGIHKRAPIAYNTRDNTVDLTQVRGVLNQERIDDIERRNLAASGSRRYIRSNRLYPR